jgi:hypothetical protein
MLEQYMPSSLTAPSGEQPPDDTQGALENRGGDELALEERAKYHICVTWQVRAS